MSGVDCERPINRYQPPDWHDRNASLVEKATTTRHVSVARRREAQELKIETDSRTKWSNFENNVKLQER